jgi:5-formyltetrahydrofolate cyclo-ligase
MRQELLSHKHDSHTVCLALDRWLRAHPELKTIAVFAALPGEVNLLDFIANHPHLNWAYPRVSGHDLIFHTVKNHAEELVSGSFGILESSIPHSEISSFAIDAFLCPGLAFDRDGGRLGRGRGFYDRMLENARPDALKIGVCFPFQIVPNTFSEPHDIRMDEVISGAD